MIGNGELFMNIFIAFSIRYFNFKTFRSEDLLKLLRLKLKMEAKPNRDYSVCMLSNNP